MIQVTPTLSFKEAIKSFADKIIQFKGRSRRSEFWWPLLIEYLLTILPTHLLGVIAGLLTIPLKIRRLHDTGRSGWWWGVSILLKLAFLISWTYDIVMAGLNVDELAGFEDQLARALIIKYAVFGFVVFAYQIVLIIFYCLDGTQGENKYGPSPKYVDDENLNEA